MVAGFDIFAFVEALNTVAVYFPITTIIFVLMSPEELNFIYADTIVFTAVSGVKPSFVFDPSA